MRPAAEAVAFLLELAALAAVAYWGFTVTPALAVVLPAAFAVVWGVALSPRARVHVPPAPKVALRTLALLLAAGALALAGLGGWAVALAAAVVADTALLVALGRPVAGG